MKLKAILIILLLPALMLMVACGDSVSKVSSGELTVEYDNAKRIKYK